MTPPATIPQLLRHAAQQYGDRLALRQPLGKDVHTWTWNQYLQAAEEIAGGLLALGIGGGDHVALCSETRAEFYLADQGILMNGSVAAALYPSYPPEELKGTMTRADAKALFVEDPKILGLDAVKGSEIIFPVVFKTLATRQYAPVREFRRRVRLALEEHHMLPGDPNRIFNTFMDKVASARGEKTLESTAALDPTALKPQEGNPFTHE